MHEVLVNRLGGLSLPRKSVVRLTDRPDMTLDVYRGRKTTIQQYNMSSLLECFSGSPSETEFRCILDFLLIRKNIARKNAQNTTSITFSKVGRKILRN